MSTSNYSGSITFTRGIIFQAYVQIIMVGATVKILFSSAIDRVVNLSMSEIEI